MRRRDLTFVVMAILVSVLIGAVGGFLTGVRYQKRVMETNAIGFWTLGATCFSNGDVDCALANSLQAVALKNDEGVFLLSVAEAYHAQMKFAMAERFYGLALSQFKKEGSNQTKAVEHRIELCKKKIPIGTKNAG